MEEKEKTPPPPPPPPNPRNVKLMDTLAAVYARWLPDGIQPFEPLPYEEYEERCKVRTSIRGMHTVCQHGCMLAMKWCRVTFCVVFLALACCTPEPNHSHTKSAAFSREPICCQHTKWQTV